MPVTNETQLAVLKEQALQNTAEHKEIKDSLNKIDCKLDDVITKKADKSELEKIDNRFWGLVVAILFLIAGWLYNALR